jgi:predicted regulator of Ras-like GTPase activity (Roadblock/LC7/MglB family)
LLGLGRARYLVVETAQARIVMVPVAPDAALLLHRGAAIPIGRLLALVNRAAQAAMHWLESMR